MAIDREGSRGNPGSGSVLVLNLGSGYSVVIL